MNTIIDIFSQDSDKAKLIIVLITAFITILVVMLNHYFQQKRDRKELYRQKIEELYHLSNAYTKRCSELIKFMEQTIPPSKHLSFKKEKEEFKSKVHDSTVPMNMLCNLYFHKENFDFSNFYPEKLPVVSKFVTPGALEESSNLVSANRVELQFFCNTLMRKHL